MHNSNGARAVGPSFLFKLLARKRDDIAERATDWVVSTSSDLQGKRPRAETKGLVEKVIDVNLAIIEKGDREPLHAFVEYVTTLRASLEFRVSTVLRGFLSFKRGLTEVLQDERVPARDQLNTFSIVDEVYYEAIFHISDVYGAKLVHTITTRRDEIELELGQKRQELEYTAEMMQRMNDDIIALSLPILRVWKGVLLVPLIGEISQERAERTRRELLDAVVKQGVRVVLIDVTGLSVVNAQAAGILGSIMRAVSLLGAESMIVGVRGEVARVLVDIGEVFPGTRTFATLDECLRRTLRIGQTS